VLRKGNVTESDGDVKPRIQDTFDGPYLNGSDRVAVLHQFLFKKSIAREVGEGKMSYKKGDKITVNACSHCKKMTSYDKIRAWSYICFNSCNSSDVNFPSPLS